MLHTLHSITQNNTVELDAHSYNIFDSRTLKSNVAMDTTFSIIAHDFIRIWNNNIKSFIDYIYNGYGIYTKAVRPVFTTEEAIYAKINNFSLDKIRGYYISKYIRIFAVPDMNTSNFSIIESLVYNNIAQENNKVLSIFMDEGMLRDKEVKEDPDILNTVLFRILHICAAGYMDYRLSSNYNVPLNRTWCKLEGSNKDAIILPEQLSLTDTRFIFNYYYTLFYIINALTNTSIIKDFDDYIGLVELPNLFMPMNIDQDSSEEDVFNSMVKIFKDIWKIANDSVDNEEDAISDARYVEICTDIALSICLNIDDMYYTSYDSLDDEI